MRKFVKGLSAALVMTLTMGMLSGCGNKKMETTFDYVASDYVEVGQYSGIEYVAEDFTVTDADLQDVIKQICEKQSVFQDVTRAAKEGDMVKLSFDAFVSGGKVEGFSDTDHELIIGSDEFIVDGFEEAIIGLKAGDKRAITGLRVPEDFATEEKYAGREITFNVVIDTVYEPIVPEYSNELVTTLTDGEYTTTEDYNKELMRMLEENAVTNATTDKYNKVFEQIVGNTKVIKDFPAEYVDSKIAMIEKELEMYMPLLGEDITREKYLMQYYGVDTVEEAVNEQILLEFIMQDIITKENLTVTKKYYDDNLEATAKARNYSTTTKFVESYGENGVVKCMLVNMAEELILNSAVAK